MTAKKIIEEALSLPVEERALIADSLLRSLNMPNSGVEDRWMEVAERRLQDLRAGQVKPVPGDDVYERALKRLSR